MDEISEQNSVERGGKNCLLVTQVLVGNTNNVEETIPS